MSELLTFGLAVLGGCWAGGLMLGVAVRIISNGRR